MVKSTRLPNYRPFPAITNHAMLPGQASERTAKSRATNDKDWEANVLDCA
jgi:hypothetical protein